MKENEWNHLIDTILSQDNISLAEAMLYTSRFLPTLTCEEQRDFLTDIYHAYDFSIS